MIERTIMEKDKPGAKSAAGRVNYIHESPEMFKALMALGNALRESSIEEKIRDLVEIGASQTSVSRPCRARLTPCWDWIKQG
jgi:hypothetical protein